MNIHEGNKPFISYQTQNKLDIDQRGLPRWLSEKTPPVKQETWVQSLGWEDPLEKEMASTPVFLPEKFHEQRSPMGYSPWGGKESDMTE